MSLSLEAATRIVDQLGAITRVVDGMLGKAAKQVADLSVDNGHAVVAGLLGAGIGEVRDAVATAKKLEELPATDAAVRSGLLSAKEASLIAAAATLNPAAEAHLLRVAKQGLVPLRDACVAARAAVEDPKKRRASTACASARSGRGPTATACGPERSGIRPKSARS